MYGSLQHKTGGVALGTIVYDSINGNLYCHEVRCPLSGYITTHLDGDSVYEGMYELQCACSDAGSQELLALIVAFRRRLIGQKDPRPSVMRSGTPVN